ncbi:hemerythrin domain-containing protein [Nocardioides sp.]|uniref:hemerythrin domain-containing protein n=1 Tax=Nocardioides sp. TaxID=35761 RepID=UPI003783975B
MIDVSGMIMAHDAFRWSLLPAADLVRGVADGDTRRAALVATHVETTLAILEGHHTSEDTLLWPRLLERVPEELAPVVHLMESQHEQIHEHLEQTLALLPRWRQGAAAGDREQLALAVDALVASLVEHMAAEEEHLLPLAARSMSESEWAELGERGIRKIPFRFLPTAFGIMRHVGDPVVVATDLAKAPLPIRTWLRLTADRAFTRYAAELGIAQ